MMLQRAAPFRFTRVAAAVIATALTVTGGIVAALSPRAVAAATAQPATDLFAPVAGVLRHPRCMNCHPRDDRPRQGEDRHIHLQNIVRGEDNMGFVNGRCTACHRDENSAFSGVPGAPNWHLAPLSMGWNGLNDAELCEAIKDKTRNGGKNVAEIVQHMISDKLVLWGWQPGGTRQPVPTPHKQFVTELKAWAAADAPCPAAK